MEYTSTYIPSRAPANASIAAPFAYKTFPLFILLIAFTQKSDITKMKFAIIALASVVAATAAVDQPLVESPVVWEVEAFKDGPTLKLEGTIQEVHKQLVAINPNYDTDFNLGATNDKVARDLSKRTDFSHSHTICGNFPSTTVDHLGQGINYLRGVGGRPSMGGRGTCGRVSCSYNTAIWWCNDVRITYSLNRIKEALSKMNIQP